MTQDKTFLRNAAMQALATTAPALFRRKQHSNSKFTFMTYEIAAPNTSKSPGARFVLLPNVRAVSTYAASGESKHHHSPTTRFAGLCPLPVVPFII